MDLEYLYKTTLKSLLLDFPALDFELHLLLLKLFSLSLKAFSLK